VQTFNETSASRGVPSLSVARPSIVCGTDFSKDSALAVEVSAALAKRLDEPLVLVHAVASEVAGNLPGNLRESLCVFERAQFHEELENARAAGAEIADYFKAGPPDAVLREAAESCQGRILVLSSHGRKPPARWLIGSVAEQTAESAPIPTLIVRTAAPFIQWLANKRRLRVFVGADFSEPSEAALRWVRWLRRLGPCDVTVAFFDPQRSLGDFAGAIPPSLFIELQTKTNPIRERLFRRRVRTLLAHEPVRIRIERGWSHSDAHLLHAAHAAKADLIVVGTHQRHGLKRLGRHSVSRGVLRYAETNVACVPCAALPEE
jgi:nucleotide-binding universal stress UspA family protein